ncbi:hypothetical protein FSP39_000114, partial [Pinctada imbricata]
FQLIAEVLTGIAGVFLIVAVVGQEWVEVKFHGTDHMFTWGLWDRCVGPGLCLPNPLWLEACQAFCLLSVLLALGAFICGFIGLCIHSRCSKHMWHTIAGILLIVVVVCDLLSLIVYPIMFSQDVLFLEFDPQWQFTVRRWDFDWTYGFGWGGFIFAVPAIIFFLIFPDKRKSGTAKPY